MRDMFRAMNWLWRLVASVATRCKVKQSYRLCHFRRYPAGCRANARVAVIVAPQHATAPVLVTRVAAAEQATQKRRFFLHAFSAVSSPISRPATIEKVATSRGKHRGTRDEVVVGAPVRRTLRYHPAYRSRIFRGCVYAWPPGAGTPADTNCTCTSAPRCESSCGPGGCPCAQRPTCRCRT
ncbi:unnamed protein product [Ixodes pacificus]